jgi:hypothetical protein
MKKFAILFMIIPALLAAACGPGETEPAAPMPSPTESAPALNTIAPTATAVPAATETPMPESETDQPEQPEETPEPAVPATVDLSKHTPSPPAADATPQEMPAPGVPSSLEPLVNDIKTHLAERLEIDAAAIEVATIEEVTWSNSSLGCPAPGMNYLMVLTPGFRIGVTAEGQQYEYHTNQSGRFVLCVNGRPAE